jgi:signal transduction histidine kinase
MRVETENESRQISVETTEFNLGGRAIKLVSLQNIANELAEQEMKAWQKLVRVLTHEIINSVAPIASLASTAGTILQNAGNGNSRNGELSQQDVSDLVSAVNAIEKRSEGLMSFVQSYRRLSTIPKPKFGIVRLDELFGRMVRLISSREEAAGIRLETYIDPPDLTLTADAALLEQVLLNLLINATQALSNTTEGVVRLTAERNDRGSVTIRVIDNGPGIKPEALESIFVPFFTTKPEGTGLGLSLSRQIVRLHGGRINVNSIPGQQTVFSINF